MSKTITIGGYAFVKSAITAVGPLSTIVVGKFPPQDYHVGFVVHLQGTSVTVKVNEPDTQPTEEVKAICEKIRKDFISELE